MDNNISEKIQIFISGRNLKDLDFFSKSDPYVKVYFRRDFNAKTFVPIHRTQTIPNNLNPNFQKSFVIDYLFQSRQDIQFQVMDDDNGNDDLIGSVETTVGALMGAKSQTSILDLKLKGKSSGKLIIRCQKSSDSNIYYAMKFKAVKLMNTDSYFDFWDKSDPFLKLLKIRQDNTFLEAYKTPYINNNLNPDWPLFEVSSAKLHHQNNTRFKIQCWDWQQSGNNNFIGECFVDARQVLQKNVFPLELALSNPKKNKPGKLVLELFRVIQRPSFIDYIRGGLQLNMIVAIDFTGSNGNPHHPTSLHYMDSKKPNQYQLAINAVSQILLNYDSDKRIPAFGFGAKPIFPGSQGYSTVSHCFPLSGKSDQIEMCGYEHLMMTYSNALKHLQFSGPTYFKPIISQAMNVAKLSRQEGSHVYQILLILTDGQIHDMQQTIDLLVQNTDIPISIIIVGVGNANFDSMNKLDGDNGLYASNGQLAKRDLVQFVPFRDVQMNPDMLTKQLLAELPGQVVQYMTMMKILPNPPLQMDINKMVPIKQHSNPNLNQQIAGLMGNINPNYQQPMENNNNQSINNNNNQPIYSNPQNQSLQYNPNQNNNQQPMQNNNQHQNQQYNPNQNNKNPYG